jgi:EAL domain-containing protein (putative c-di-GMP-specific phosphodiesterase class I)
VHGLGHGPEDAAIISAVIELAHKLGLITVAEGIEELAQAERLRRMRCEIGQGFGLGAPEPAARVAEFLARQRYSQAA